MWVQIASALISVFHTMFTSFIWMMMQKYCHPGNDDLLSEVIEHFKLPSSAYALYQIKIHLMSSSFIGLMGMLANISKSFHGMRICVLMKMVVLMWGILGILFMYCEGFDISQLVCFTVEGLDIVTGFFVFSVGHFLSLLWHINHIKNKGLPSYHRRQITKPSSFNENRVLFTPIATKSDEKP